MLDNQVFAPDPGYWSMSFCLLAKALYTLLPAILKYTEIHNYYQTSSDHAIFFLRKQIHIIFLEAMLV